MRALDIRQFFCGRDNYGVLIHDPASGETAAVDTPELGPIRSALSETGWRLTHIFTTHHHGDHVAGHEALRRETGCAVVAAAADAHRIPAVTVALREGEAARLGDHEFVMLDTPGHTRGHVAYHCEAASVAFVGDTLFSLGCGRLLEGTADEMHASLAKLAALPAETMIYCGHEYTLANARFALTIDSENAALRRRAAEAEALRADGKPCAPMRLADELRANPFLRVHDEAVQSALGIRGAPEAEVFAEMRRRKDKFA
ncbi:MAG: hydroxyacylglutathione hydrolase [Hyphomicrobiales bacterium]|nr:hydroxyacylglutathione hydrolase [Hyphomicrobiales bacterium]